ncbi:ABC transporter substrate-binding protein [Stagnihabitans tardus]|uniref:ABC transporter substrate-binding protein n=1 Tax=Stagnihabitans tardus TaxID=2699202 RepID=A0AAE4YH63_9RHOB|nr:ABC transporter substrate-binding protein [Stagnihabitans tardus]NBZ89920.1 ABC transporter substrate-binding protein [Stagnihabitans tardus]
MIQFRLVRQIALAVLLASPVAAQEASPTDTLTFAQVAALTGPASALGTGMRDGITAAFAEANAAGGVGGLKLALDSLDDGYEPDQSVAQLETVLAKPGYLALIGPVGTPTNQAMVPMAASAGLPVIGPFTGAGFLRDPALTNVFNLRASYGAETEAWMAHLVDDLGMKRIAILYQDDGFGRAGLDGAKAALERRGMTLVAEGTYVRNTTAVKSALLDIRKAEPEAVVMVGAYKPVAEFVRLSRKLKFEPTFVNISFVGSGALAAELGADGAGVIVSQVVPLPWDTSVPVVVAYQAALAAHVPDAKIDFVSLEGYLVGRLAIEALKAAGANPTRESYLKALQGVTAVDLGGLGLQYGPGDNQGSDSVFLTRITPEGGFEIVNPGGSS